MLLWLIHVNSIIKSDRLYSVETIQWRLYKISWLHNHQYLKYHTLMIGQHILCMLKIGQISLTSYLRIKSF